METKEWLNQGRYLTKEIRALKDALDKADKMADCVLDSFFSKYKETLEDKIRQLSQTNEDIISTIYKVEDNILRTLLIERFINNKTWEMVAHRLGYDFYHVIKRLYPKAVSEVDKIISLKAS